MKTKILLLALLLSSSLLFAVQVNDKDTCKNVVTACIDTAQINDLIDVSNTADSTKVLLKDVVSDIPMAIEKTKELIDIFEKKDSQITEKTNDNNFLSLLLQIITWAVGAITLFETMARKIRALPCWMSPYYWFKKLLGKHNGIVDGEKGVWHGDIFIPENKTFKIIDE